MIGLPSLVVAHLLEQRLRRALGDAAVDLALEQHRVEHRAGVVARDVAQVADLAGLGVDLDDGDVAAERERRRRPRRRSSAALEAAVAGGGAGQVGPRLAHGRRAGDVEGAVVHVEHDVGGVGLEQAGGDVLGLLDQRLGGPWTGGAALLQRARAHRAAAALDEVGVAPDDVDLVHRDAGARGAIIDHAVTWPWPCGEVPV